MRMERNCVHVDCYGENEFEHTLSGGFGFIDLRLLCNVTFFRQGTSATDESMNLYDRSVKTFTHDNHCSNILEKKVWKFCFCVGSFVGGVREETTMMYKIVTVSATRIMILNL